jgi:hypothetical protein
MSVVDIFTLKREITIWLKVSWGHLYETMNACDRETKTLNLNLAGGSGYLYDIPTITPGS